MINISYRISAAKILSADFYDEVLKPDDIIVRANYLGIAKDDINLFFSQSENISYPIAPIHEACARVLFDPKNELKAGTNVVLLPYGKVFDDGNIKKYRSQNRDGFMQNFIVINRNRVVECELIDPTVATQTQNAANALRMFNRFNSLNPINKNVLAFYVDNSLGYIACLAAKKLYAKSRIVAVSNDPEKLRFFSFADSRYLINALPAGLSIDHTFILSDTLCEKDFDRLLACSRNGAIISLNPNLLSKFNVDLRKLNEKNIIISANNAAEQEDFIAAVAFLKRYSDTKAYIKNILTDVVRVKNISDIQNAFNLARASSFSCVMSWEV